MEEIGIVLPERVFILYYISCLPVVYNFNNNILDFLFLFLYFSIILMFFNINYIKNYSYLVMPDDKIINFNYI